MSNCVEVVIVATDRYCRGCDNDGVNVILDDVSYSGHSAAICERCGHEFEIDVSDYDAVDVAAERFDIERKENHV